MKTIPLIVALSMVWLQMLSYGATVNTFPGGAPDASVQIIGPGYQTVLNLTLPADCVVLNATFNVTNVQGDCPDAPEVLLDGTLLWAFNGTGYGSLGRQDHFSDGATQLRAQLATGGGTGTASLRLPKGAVVESATAILNVTGPKRNSDFAWIDGLTAGEQSGCSVSGAGDVNNDSYDDVIVGASANDDGGTNAGCARVYLGGPAMNTTPFVTLTGIAQGDRFGLSVSGAGDVNNDGYDDVIVGAPYSLVGGITWGSAHVFFGGTAMDSTPDVSITTYRGGCGCSVAGCGDVNKDGYDDVIVGSNNANANRGAAYVFFGGQAMDATADITFAGTVPSSQFGSSVSSAGDLNNDGYVDITIGAPKQTGAVWIAGTVYIYLGSQAMDSTPDVLINGTNSWDTLGSSVCGAGDLNGDGYDDLAMGAPTTRSLAYIYFGGPVLDNVTDVNLTGDASTDYFGGSVSGAGDLNGDGYDDVVVGACSNDSCGIDSGRAYVYFGGPAMDNSSDLRFDGAAAYDNFSYSVSGAGDVNNDGNDDIIVGAINYDGTGTNAGRACLYSSLSGILNSSVTFGSVRAWNRPGFFNGTGPTDNFTVALNGYLGTAAVSGSDIYGNSYVDVPVVVRANSIGNITLFNLSVTYRYDAAVPDFTGTLNSYIAAHESQKDAGGNLRVPITVRSQTAGALRLHDLSIRYDGAPVLAQEIPELEMDEDKINGSLLDLWECFDDEYTPDSSLNFTVVNATSQDIVALTVNGNRYLAADALTGPANDNWTGTVHFRLLARDRRGQSVLTSAVNLTVKNINDAPVITSSPPLNATSGTAYGYQLVAIDGDSDNLTFSLERKPETMTISAAGKSDWIPSAAGIFNVSVAVGDGQATVYQNFTINVTSNITVPVNRQPRFTSTPVTNATVGSRYVYEARATDDDNDSLNYSLLSAPGGMTVDPLTGKIGWSPSAAQGGTHEVTVVVQDGRGGRAEQKFSVLALNVIPPLLPVKPSCNITSIANGTTVSKTLILAGMAARGTAPLTSVQVRIDGGNWSLATGTENWTFILDTKGLGNGEHRVDARAFDGNLYSDTQTVNFKMYNPPVPVSRDSFPYWIVALVAAITGFGMLAWWGSRKKQQ